jgi:hypothetical protein
MCKIHKKNMTFSAREHRTQNTRGGVVVTPPAEPTNCPGKREKKPPGAPGGQHSQKNGRYTTVTLRLRSPLFSRSIQPRGRCRERRTERAVTRAIELLSIRTARQKYLKKQKYVLTNVYTYVIIKPSKGGTKNVSIFKRLQRGL